VDYVEGDSSRLTAAFELADHDDGHARHVSLAWGNRNSWGRGAAQDRSRCPRLPGMGQDGGTSVSDPSPTSAPAISKQTTSRTNGQYRGGPSCTSRTAHDPSISAARSGHTPAPLTTRNTGGLPWTLRPSSGKKRGRPAPRCSCSRAVCAGARSDSDRTSRLRLRPRGAGCAGRLCCAMPTIVHSNTSVGARGGRAAAVRLRHLLLEVSCASSTVWCARSGWARRAWPVMRRG